MGTRPWVPWISLIIGRLHVDINGFVPIKGAEMAKNRACYCNAKRLGLRRGWLPGFQWTHDWTSARGWLEVARRHQSPVAYQATSTEFQVSEQVGRQTPSPKPRLPQPAQHFLLCIVLLPIDGPQKRETVAFPDCWSHGRWYRSVSHRIFCVLRNANSTRNKRSFVTYPTEFVKTRSQFGGKVHLLCCYALYPAADV